jgi:hypothetical protein
MKLLIQGKPLPSLILQSFKIINLCLKKNLFQGCGGTLNGTVPSSGTLQWVINAADLMIVSITFSDWTVG